MALGLALMPFTVYPQSDQKPTGTPPISQTLVPEGDFALKLATALKVGTPTDEAQAEDMLTSAGIAPKNGWIADYPITPNIIGELQNSVATAADSKKLSMGKDEALKAFQGLTTELGLAVSPGGAGEYAENQPQPDASAINNYYYEEGPPVVSYYPPPWDYDYLYDWVPYPFWASGFFFPGFFVLTDFDFVFVGHHHHHHRITNHFFNSRTHAFGRVDPVRHSWTNSSHTTAFNSTATRNAASSIFNRSMGRTTFARGTQGMTGNHASTLSGAQGRRGVATNNRGNTTGGRTFSNSSRFATGSGMDHRSSQSFSRSSSAPSSRGSFSCANCHGGSNSFGHSSGHSFGGFSGSHASGGFSGGHSSGGFSGGGHGGGGGRR
ncbi:MAG: hypothetical protein WBN53_01390 [Thermodesulfobacteriota bacterium]